MSIPRLAIQRPVTMFMISMVIILLGGISLTRLPVDLMPDTQVPTHHRARQLHGRRSARDGGAGHAPDRAGGQRRRRPRARRLDLVRGQRQRPPQLRLGHRPQRSRRRSPHPPRSRARPHARGRRPADGLQVRLERHADHGHRRRGRLRPGDAARDGAERPVAAPRARRRRRRRDDRRRPAPPDSRRPVAREDHRRSTSRRIAWCRSCAPRTRTSRSAKSTTPTARCCCAAPASSTTSTRSSNIVVLTREGVPVYMRDIADVQRRHRGPPLVHAHQRHPRHPHAGDQAVGHQHHPGRRRRARRKSRDQPGSPRA